MAVTAPPAPAVPARKEARPAPEGRSSRLRHKLDVKGTPYLYVAPFFLIFLVFGMFPILYTGWMAFTRMLSGAYSSAAVLVSPTTPCFEAT